MYQGQTFPSFSHKASFCEGLLKIWLLVWIFSEYIRS